MAPDLNREGLRGGTSSPEDGSASPTMVNAGGAWARSLAQMGGPDVPVVPDSHEGGVTEPVAAFLGPMLVDIRPAPGSRNYYFYQHKPGAVVFCITPDPPIVGWSRELEGYAHAVGMCAQGYMLGPGVGALVSRLVRKGLNPGDQETLDGMSPDREFGGNEALR